MPLTRAAVIGLTFKTTAPGCAAPAVVAGVDVIIGGAKIVGIAPGRFSPTPAA